MAIAPIYNNAMLQRTQDIGQIKHNEDNRPQVEQSAIQHTTEKNVEKNLKTVVEKENIFYRDQEKHDAKEEGRGIFFDIRKKKVKDNEGDNINDDTEDGVVINKKNSHFDMRI